MKHLEPPPDKNIIFELGADKLIKLLQNEELNKALHDIDKDYPYWEKFRRKVRDLDDPKLLWSYIKIIRARAISSIKVSEIPGFNFTYNSTAKILKYLHLFDMHLGGVLEGRAIIPVEDKHRYLISSIMEEAIASSQLEGAATTREIAKQMLRSKRKPRNLSEKMILNNYHTINKVLEIRDKKISKDLILEIHSTISKDTLKNKSNEGKFRENNDVKIVDEITGEVFYIPPDFNKIERLIECFCEFANDDSDDLNFVHPIIKGIILHFLIGYIHPFVDGNGRTARAIFYWYLISKGYWLVEYMSISKIIIRAPAQYARAYLYCEHDDNDLTYFIDYNLKCMNLALQSLQSYIKRKVMEKQNLFYLIQHENINERQAEILRSLIVDNRKSYTIKEVESLYGIVYQTARTDLLGLQILGYIKEKKFGKKLIFFKVDDFEKKLEDVFMDAPHQLHF